MHRSLRGQILRGEQEGRGTDAADGWSCARWRGCFVRDVMQFNLLSLHSIYCILCFWFVSFEAPASMTEHLVQAQGHVFFLCESSFHRLSPRHTHESPTRLHRIPPSHPSTVYAYTESRLTMGNVRIDRARSSTTLPTGNFQADP